MPAIEQPWLVVGSEKNWKYAFENGNIWGLQDVQFMQAHWQFLAEGDLLLFYVRAPVSGIVGCGRLVTKFRQTTPLWPDEVEAGTVMYPLRFEFEVEYCLPGIRWLDGCYREPALRALIRNGFQCISARLRADARRHFGLAGVATEAVTRPAAIPPGSADSTGDHAAIQQQLKDIGSIQGFIAEVEYPIEGNRLDVVWRRVAGSVPTYAFEVQVGGDIYHAVAKLKHAFDLWNSHIFLVADATDRAKCDELLDGTFHEVKSRLRFLHLSDVAELHKRKVSYREMERAMGIIQ